MYYSNYWLHKILIEFYFKSWDQGETKDKNYPFSDNFYALY